jgi:hypothetical protein
MPGGAGSRHLPIQKLEIPAREVVQEQHRIGFSIWSQARSMPMRSRPSVAVAQSGGVDHMQGTPSIWMVCCTTSRVVPATGVTMASSAPARR